jgi:hypothetical protein
VKPLPISPNEPLETILVVDDDEMVLNLVVAILESANFRVLSADSGANAVKLAAETEGPIHLLLSDVDMQPISGPKLGQVLRNARANMRVMLMSGGNNGLLVLNYGWAYLQKPFMAVKLVQMVTEVLHMPNRSQRGDEFDRRKDTGGQ